MAMEITALRVQLVFTGVTDANHAAFRTGLVTKLGDINIPGVTLVPKEKYDEVSETASVDVGVEGVGMTDFEKIATIANGAYTKFHEVDHGGGITSTVFRALLDVRPEVTT